MMTDIIKLSDIWDIKNPYDYKIHLACKNERNENPLDVWLGDDNRWQGWQEHYPGKDEFNRPFVFSMMQIDAEGTDRWLFGGIWWRDGLDKNQDGTGHQYQMELTEQLEGFIGRLKLQYKNLAQRKVRRKLEPSYNKIVVTEILPKRFTKQ